jgi:hypothetical protein
LAAQPTEKELKKAALQKECADMGLEIGDAELASLKIGEIRARMTEHKRARRKASRPPRKDGLYANQWEQVLTVTPERDAPNSAASGSAEEDRSASARAEDVSAAQSILQSPRATSGKEAFDGTAWSVLMKMYEGGSMIFSMQLLEDLRCRFSDSEDFGSWESQDAKNDAWVVVEKPKGYFDATLFFSAKLAPPAPDHPKWRLVEGIVQMANLTASDGDTVELQEIGTFGANEFEEALLSTLGRNRPEGGEDDAD